jgi:hypothetical protein
VSSAAIVVLMTAASAFKPRTDTDFPGSSYGRTSRPAWRARRRAVPQHVHVIDAVRACGHARDEGRHLQLRIDAALAAGADMLRDEARQPGTPGERHHRDQPGVRHEIRLIELSGDPRQRMQQLHLQGVLSNLELEASTTPILPAQRAPFTLTRRKTPLFDRVDRGLGAVRKMVLGL